MAPPDPRPLTGTPRPRVADGALHMRMACPGAKPVTEWMGMGDGEFHEPNQGLVYAVKARWEGDTFIAARRVPPRAHLRHWRRNHG